MKSGSLLESPLSDRLVEKLNFRNFSYPQFSPQLLYSLVVPESLDLHALQTLPLPTQLATVEGHPLDLTSCPACVGRVKFNNATILRPDLASCNGVLHVVGPGILPTLNLTDPDKAEAMAVASAAATGTEAQQPVARANSVSEMARVLEGQLAGGTQVRPVPSKK